MAISITDVTGTITVTGGDIEINGDLQVTTDVTVTENIVVAGDIHIENEVTESTSSLPTFSLNIRGLDLVTSLYGYIYVPCDCDIISMHAVLVELIDGYTGAPPQIQMTVDGTPEAEVLLVGDESSPLYSEFSITYASPTSAEAGDVLYIVSNATADGTGTVDVTLICQPT